MGPKYVLFGYMDPWGYGSQARYFQSTFLPMARSRSKVEKSGEGDDERQENAARPETLKGNLKPESGREGYSKLLNT